MAEEQELLRLEALGKQFYETTDPIARSEAETALVNFANLQDCLGKCQLLLERGTSPYAQLIAATTLTKLIGRTTVALPLHQRIDIRNYLLNYLATRPKLPTFVTQALVQLFARITKLGWFDSDKDRFVFRDVTEDVATLLQGGSPQHIMLGVQIFSQVVTEMNQISESEANRSIMRHRKIASSFRDTQLFEIFQISCNLLKDANTNLKNINLNDPHQHGLLCSCLQLAQNCLTFDFIGTSTDESSDDLCTVQIPTCWRTIFLDFTILDLFFDLYKNLPPSLAALALGCLVQISSVRRSLFNNPERSLFLNRLVSGVQAILENPQGLLSDPSCYHEFCRLLARLKSNYQLGELVKVDSYPAVIKLIAEFTITSLQVWHFAPNSIHYLLSLWQRLVASMPYVKANEPHMLETYTPEVTKAYITSRLTSVGRILRDGLEDPLDDWGTVSQQLDQLSTIGRCEYEKTCALLVQLFDESAQRYQELLARAAPNSNDIELSTQEGILSWLVYVIGAVIGGRISFASTDEHDAMDGELACRVLQLMNLVDSRLMQRRCEKLDLAILSFFEQFRKIYIGEQVQKTSKVYKRLMDVLGLHEESMVLSVYIRKIITNLKYWSSSEAIVSRTLQLLSDLSVGYSSVRKLVKLDTVLFILSNHTSEHFPFLGIAGMSTVTDSRCRTTLYTALGRLLMVDLGEDEAKFESFMIPITNSFEALGQMLTNVDTPLFRSDDCKKSLVGLARDLRGIAYAFNTKVSYMMLYDWLYPPYMPMLLRAVELWYHDPAVTTPVLKLMCELAQNRAQRLQFEVSSPNGILLFREISKLMVAYGSRILTLTNLPKEQVYPLKLKGIAICFNMLKAALCGNYVNFGVFRLYGDTALDSALAMFVKMLLSVSQGDLLDYPKLGQSYYALTECLAQDHITFVCSLEPQVFLYILSTISDGLSALDTMVSTGCCSILDNIVTYLFKKVTKKQSKSISSSSAVTADGQGFLRILEMHPEILQQMLSTVLNIIMFEDCRNQWSMSRPLLGLILLNEEYFAKLRRSIIENQPAGEKQLVMEQCFNTLMDGIEYSLLSKNRDRFTQNLSKFRHDVNDSVRGQQGGGDANGGDTVVANVDMML